MLSITVEPTWTPAGPHAVSGGNVEGIITRSAIGAVEALAAHPTDPDILFAGAVNGGIWKTENATAPIPSWTPLTDDQPSLSIGAISFDPTDDDNDFKTLIAGIGGFSSFQGTIGPLTGLLRTTDGGNTWTPLPGATGNCPLPDAQPGDMPGQGIPIAGQRVRSVFARGQRILAATTTGVFVSDNGGACFTQTVVPPPSANIPNNASSTVHLAADPTNLMVFFAGVPGGATGGVWRTTDGGGTWTQVNNGLTNFNSTIRIETSVGANGVVFAGLIGGNFNLSNPLGGPFAQLQSVFSSFDGGTTWFDMGVPTTLEAVLPFNPVGIHDGGQADLHFSIVADPGDQNVVYVAGDRQPLTDDQGCEKRSGRIFRGVASPGASTWEHLNCGFPNLPGGPIGANGTSPHADSRDMVFDANFNLLEADDGGIYRLINPSNDPFFAARAWVAVNGDLAVTEFLSVAFDPELNMFTGGAMDNGTLDSNPGSLGWRTALGGDGGFVDVVAIPNLSTYFRSKQNFEDFQRQPFFSGVAQAPENVLLSVVGTDCDGDPCHLLDFDQNIQFIQPWVLNSVNPNRMLIGTQFLYESSDRGDTLVPIGGPANPMNFGPISATAYGGSLNGTPNEDVAWIGSPAPMGPAGSVFLRTAAGGAFTALASYPGGTPVDITLDPDNFTTAFVVDNFNTVWRTNDMGVNWQNVDTGSMNSLVNLIAASFPAGTNVPINSFNSVEFVPPKGSLTAGALVVGTDSGVYATLNPMATPVQWLELGVNLPNAVVTDLRYYDPGSPKPDRLVVGTFGRGAWSIPDAAEAIANAGKLIIEGDMDPASDDDTITVARNAANPNLLDVFVNNASVPALSIPMLSVRCIDIRGGFGQDTILVDLRNPIAGGSANIFPGDIIIDGGPGDLDSISVELPSFGGVLTINGGDGNRDRISVSQAFGMLNGFPNAMTMSFNGGNGSDDRLILSDSATTADFDYGFVAHPNGVADIARNDGKLFRHEGFEAVQLNAGDGDNNFEVTGTPPGSDLVVFGGAGTNTFLMGSDSPITTVNDIRSHVEYVGIGPSTDFAIIDDRGDGAPTSVTVTRSTVDDEEPTRPLFGLGGSFRYQNLDGLAIHLGSNMDEVTVEGISADTFINTYSENDTITVGVPTDPDGGPGPDDRPRSVDLITRILDIDGGDEFDVLNVNDLGAMLDKRMTLTATTIGLDDDGNGNQDLDTFFAGGNGWIEYEMIDEISVKMGQHGNTVFVESTDEVTENVFIETGDGNDTVTIANAADTLNGIHSVINLNGQSGTGDSLTINDAGESTAATYTLNANLTDGRVIRELGQPIPVRRVDYTAWEQVHLNTGTSGDTVLVSGTVAPASPSTEVTTMVNTGLGDDIIDVGTPAGLADGVVSQLVVDGGDDGDGIGNDGTLTLNDESEAAFTSLTVTSDEVFGMDFFGLMGQVKYANLSALSVRVGNGGSNVEVRSTPLGTLVDLTSGNGKDDYFFEDNGQVDGIESHVEVHAGAGPNEMNEIFVQNNAGSGDTVSLVAITDRTGHIGAADGDNYFGQGAGAILYHGISSVTIAGNARVETFTVAPSPKSINVNGTAFMIAGGAPGFADPQQRDRVKLDLTGVSVPEVALLTPSVARLTSTTHAPVQFEDMELVDVIGGGPFDLIVDRNEPDLNGNDSFPDSVQVSSGGFQNDKTLELSLDGIPALAAVETAVNSLAVIGSTDEDTFSVFATADGLPNLAGSAPGGHTNSAFDNGPRTPKNVSIHFDGGTGPAVDSLGGDLAIQNGGYIADMVGPPNSGVFNFDGQFTMSFVNLEPINLQSAGGSFEVDASLLTGMTQILLLASGNKTFEVSGDGGLETTTFRGYDSFVIQPPDGVVLEAGRDDGKNRGFSTAVPVADDSIVGGRLSSRYTVTQPGTMDAVSAAAARLGGQLVTINDPDEDDLVLDLFAGPAYGQEFYIGATDRAEEGVWRWLTGQPLAYEGWRPGEPSDPSGAEDSAVHSRDGWVAKDGQRELRGIVEFGGRLFYSIVLDEGEDLRLATETPGAPNVFDPLLRLYGPSQQLVAEVDDTATDGKNVFLEYVVPDGEDGTYFVEILPAKKLGGTTEGEFRLIIGDPPLPPPAVVQDVRIFYNHSAFDGNDPAGNDADVNAIDMTKTPLGIGQSATFENITGYSKGLNGVMFVVSGLPNDRAILTAADFRVRVGTTDNVSAWTDGPSPTVTVLPNSTTSGAARVLLTFPAGAIQDTYAAFEMLSTPNTGLPSSHLAIFGNVRGDTGAALAGQGVFFGRGAGDLQAMAQRDALFRPAGVESVTDVDKNGTTNAFDFQGLAVAGINLIALPVIAPAFDASPAPGFAAAAVDEALTDDPVVEAASFPPPDGTGPTRGGEDARVGSTEEEDRDLAFLTFAGENDGAHEDLIGGLAGERSTEYRF